MLEFCQALFALMLVGTLVALAIAWELRRRTRERLEYLAWQLRDLTQADPDKGDS